nr:helix-turn-helix domain-containing protein [Clostridium saccharobutylicum]
MKKEEKKEFFNQKVFKLLNGGYSISQIAKECNISEIK